MSAPHGGPDAAAEAGRAAQERLSQEARATASALLDWLGTRVDRAGGPGDAAERGGERPAQSPGPCTWCPVCALVAALRGEQPELTARLAEQASGLMALLRLMVQAHQDPGHGHHHAHHHGHHGHHHAHHAPPAQDEHGPAGAGPPPAPAGWPAEWGAWEGWGAGGATNGAPPAAPEVPGTPVPPPTGATEPATPAGPAPAGPPLDPTAAAPTDAGPAGVGRRRPPGRRASPRSAAFRGLDVPIDDSADGSGSARTADGQHPEPVPEPVSQPVTPEPTPVHATPAPAPAGSGRARSAAPPAGGPVRPSVQRIAIRRPARRDGAAGRDGDPTC